MTRSALLIANMHSRRCQELSPTALEALQAAGFTVSQPELPQPEHVPDLVREQAPKHDCVIVMGGDGTVNTALPALRELKLPMGLIPAGTANDLARTLGIPLEVKEAVDIIAAGQSRPIDIAEVNGRPYVNAASFGLTGEITRQLDGDTKKRWGVFAYVLAAWRALRRARGFGTTIKRTDGSLYVRTIQVVVGNGRSFGGGMTVDESATIDDGVLHLYSILALPWWKVLLLLPALRMGTHANSRHVHNAVGEQFEIHTRRPIPISADGEILCHTPATFKVYRAALNVFAPDQAS